MVTFGTEFLACPELFPARVAGEPWGHRDLTIDFLGGPYVCAGLDDAQLKAVCNHFQAPATEDDVSPAVEIRFYRADESDFRSFDLKGWEYRLDLDYHTQFVRVAGLKFMGLLEWRPRLAGAVWTSVLEHERFCEVFENFLRAAAQYRLLGSSALLVHSAALVLDGRAYLFPGRSGAGKSTLCRLAAANEWLVLSDELNALFVRGGATYIQQVPFAGDFGRTSHTDGSFPLAGVFRVEQAQADCLAPLSSPRALATLLSCTPFVNVDPYRREHAQSVLEKVVFQHPAYTFEFSLSGKLAALDRFRVQTRVSSS